MKRISSDATCRAEYLALVAEVGSWVAVGMEEQGNRLVAQECARVRQALERGLPLNAVVRPEAASCLGLEPLVTAALASGQLIVSPCFYAGAGHVLDLGATVSFGYGVAEIATRSAMLTRGGQIALKAQLLADPARARMLTCLLEIPAAQQAMSAGEFARKCEVKNGEVRKHLRILCRAGLIEAIHVGQKVQYRVCKSLTLSIPCSTISALNSTAAMVGRVKYTPSQSRTQRTFMRSSPKHQSGSFSSMRRDTAFLPTMPPANCSLPRRAT